MSDPSEAAKRMAALMMLGGRYPAPVAQEPEASRQFADSLAAHISKTLTEPQEPGCWMCAHPWTEHQGPSGACVAITRQRWTASEGLTESVGRCSCPRYLSEAPVTQEPHNCYRPDGRLRDECKVEKRRDLLAAINAGSGFANGGLLPAAPVAQEPAASCPDCGGSGFSVYGACNCPAGQATGQTVPQELAPSMDQMFRAAWEASAGDDLASRAARNSLRMMAQQTGQPIPALGGAQERSAFRDAKDAVMRMMSTNLTQDEADHLCAMIQTRVRAVQEPILPRVIGADGHVWEASERLNRVTTDEQAAANRKLLGLSSGPPT